MANPVDELLGFTPYSWVPKDWETNPPGTAAPALPPLVEEAVALEAAPPIPPPPEPAMYAPPPVEEPVPLQPGTGLPQSSLAGVQPEIEMPPEYVGQGTPEVDAISGVDAEPPPVPEEAAEPVEQTPSGFFNPVDFSSWADPLSSADLFEMGVRDPVGYALHQQSMADAAAANVRRAQEPIEQENSRRREQEVKDLMETQAKANAIRDRVMNAKIDTGRWWASRSVPQKVASYIAVIVGGLMQGRRGGPNQALQMIDAEIDRDIAEQSANLDKDRSMIAQLRADGMSDFQAKQAIRSAWYNAALADIETKRQDFEPAGTTQARYAQAALEIRGRLQAAANAAGKDAFEMERLRRKDAREEAELSAKLRKMDAETAKLQGRGGGTGTGTKKGNLSAQEVRDMLGPDASVPVPDRPGGYTPVQAKQIAELAKSTRDVRQFETEEDRKLGVRGPDGKLMLSADTGKPLRLRSDADATELTKQINSTNEAVRMMDEVIRLRAKYGWSSDLFKSPEWLTMKQTWADLIIEKKNIAQLGALSESDMDLVTTALGAKDPTSVQDQTAGILSSRRNAVMKLQGSLRQRGFAEGSIPKYKPLNDLSEAKLQAGDADRLLVLRPGKVDRDGPNAGVGYATSEQLGVVDKWAGSLSSNDPEVAEQARRDLTNAANNAKMAEVRERAQAALNKLLTPGNGTPEETSDVESRSVARDSLTVPKPKKKEEKPKKPIKRDSAGNPL